MRTLPLFLLAACTTGVSIDGLDDKPGEGWATDPYETWTTQPPDGTHAYDGATIQVISPSAGDLLNSGVSHHFEAVVRAEDGTVLPVDDIEWHSDLSPNWFETGPAFDTDGLPIGLHAFTARAELPNGASLQHTVGGVKVQHPFGGTYAGLLQFDGSVTNIPISCVGAGLIVVDRYGEIGTGDGDCLVTILALQVPLHLLYDLEIAPDATIGGTVGVDLLGWFTYNFDAVGSLDPSATMTVGFTGNVPLMGPMSGTTDAERISLDAQ